MHTYRDKVLQANHHTGVGNKAVPQSEYVVYRLQQHCVSKKHEIEAGHQIAQAEYVDTCGASDENQA